MPEELYCYLNGKVMKESRPRFSPFDRGFLWGDGVYEITPCFNRRLYRLKDHLDRLYRSLRYVRIDLGMNQEEMEKLTLDLQGVNLPHLGEESVYRVGHWVTRGMDTRAWPPGLQGLPPCLSSGDRAHGGHQAESCGRGNAGNRSHPKGAPSVS